MSYTLDGYENYFADLFEKNAYPIEGREAILSAFSTMKSDADASAALLSFIQKYDEGETRREFFTEGREKIGAAAERLGLPGYTGEFIFYLCLVPTLEKKYGERGIDKKIFYDSMVDLRCKLIECHKLHGVWGQFVKGWFNGWFAVDRFALGRLQYEIRKSWFITVCGGHLLLPGRKMLNIHIPSSGPLNEEDVVASFKAAYGFFRDKFPSNYILFHTSSWLLFDEHRKMLPPTSNIVKFMDKFQIVLRFIQPTNEDFWRVFYRKYDKNKLDVSGNTALARGYAKLLSEGRHMGSAVGVFLYDGKTFIKGRDSKRRPIKP